MAQKHWAGSVVAASLLLAWSSAMAQSQGPVPRPPLSIAKQGYVYAGGHYDTTIPGSPMVGQLYAEYQIPAHQTHPYPVVMWPGGGQTGTNFTSTPDGREGWAEYFVRRGYAVYVVDQVGRGRAAYWQQAYGAMTPPRLDFALQRFAAPERFKLWPQAVLHTQWPGKAEVGSPGMDDFMATQVPSIANFALQQKLNADAGAALLDKIGPAVILTHSQSGAFNWPLLDRRPDKIRALLAMEPSGPPVHDVINNGAPNWFSDDPRTKISGLGDVPLDYDPPVTPDKPLSVVRDDQPASPDKARCWRQAEPARKLVHVENVPILVVTTEASYHAPYDDCTVAWLQQAGAKHLTHVSLPAVGIHGNGHMMMIEKNNLAIAALVANWLDKTIPK